MKSVTIGKLCTRRLITAMQKGVNLYNSVGTMYHDHFVAGQNDKQLHTKYGGPIKVLQMHQYE
jgi:hypothetical protein